MSTWICASPAGPEMQHRVARRRKNRESQCHNNELRPIEERERQGCFTARCKTPSRHPPSQNTLETNMISFLVNALNMWTDSSRRNTAPAPGWKARPALEKLENREVPAIFYSMDSSAIVIKGTNLNDLA